MGITDKGDMRCARWIFAIAAAYGLLATLSLYLRAPLTADTLWLFAFAGAAAVTQLLYVAIAIDPRRFCALIPIGIASKLSFAVPVLLLWGRGTVDRGLGVAGFVDLALAVLFAFAFISLTWRKSQSNSVKSRTAE